MSNGPHDTDSSDDQHTVNVQSMHRSGEDKHELIEIVSDLTEIASKRNFRKTCKVNPELTERIKSLMYIFDQVLKSTGTTEYSTIDRGYTGDQIGEKYKNSVVSSWKNKTEKKNTVKKITHDEIMDATNTYLHRRLEFQNKREKKRIESGKVPRKLEHVTGTTDESGKVNKRGVAVYAYEERQEEEFASSEDDDENVINYLFENPAKKRVRKKTPELTFFRKSRTNAEPSISFRVDPNMKRLKTKKPVIKTRRRRHTRSVPLSPRVDTPDESTSSGSDINLPEKKSKMYALEKLDDVHNFHMSILDGEDSDE